MAREEAIHAAVESAAASQGRVTGASRTSSAMRSSMTSVRMRQLSVAGITEILRSQARTQPTLWEASPSMSSR